MLDTRDVAEGWRELLERAYVPFDARPEPEPGEDFEARVSRYALGDLALVDYVCGRGSGRRGPREISATPDVLGFLVLYRGSVGLDLDGRTVLLSPGQSVLWDGARSGSFSVLSPIAKRTLIVPRDRLRAVFPRYEDAQGQGLRADNPAVQLLAGYLETLVHVADGLEAVDRVGAANAALELLAAALGAAVPPESPGLRAALVASARRFIDQNLGDPRLCPTSIAHAHSVSVRTLHEAFETTGESVSTRIRRRRLERCHAELATGTDAITTVALRWGFRNPSHFSRVFRARYGASPREVRPVTRPSV